MKNAFVLVLLVPLLGACGDPEPAPVESGLGASVGTEQPGLEASANSENEADVEVNVGGGEEQVVAKDDVDNGHPHPEWETIEIDPALVVAAIDPEEYVANIREALKHHGTYEDPIPIDTDFLGAWEFDEMQANPFPPHVRAVNGKYVTVKGFMLPDVDFEGITSFHLVRSLWGCCFGAPPRLNELLTVTTPDEVGLRYTYNTLEIIGKLEVVFETEDGLINDLYRLKSDSIVEGEYDDPLAPEGASPEQDMKGFLPEMEF